MSAIYTFVLLHANGEMQPLEIKPYRRYGAAQSRALKLLRQNTMEGSTAIVVIYSGNINTAVLRPSYYMGHAKWRQFVRGEKAGQWDVWHSHSLDAVYPGANPAPSGKVFES